VVADLCAIAHNLGRSVIDRVGLDRQDRPIANFGDTRSRYYLRIQVADVSGVLAQIARVLAEHEISISSVMQHETDDTARIAEIVIMTHPAVERRMTSALVTIGRLDVVREISAFLRVEK
jgi:homoserine dehydrogenase